MAQRRQSLRIQAQLAVQVREQGPALRVGIVRVEVREE